MNPLLRGLALGLLALAAGALHAVSFAPWERPWLQVLALATLFALTRRVRRPGPAALLGLAFGLGWFGVGVSWVYISMHVYGLMPAPLAAAATAAFCAFLALYPALALGVAQRVAPAPFLRLALALPATWSLSEWLRGTLLTGFPWLASGYAHTDGPLAGFAPVVGVYGISLVAALLAGALALFALPLHQRGTRGYIWAAGVLVVTLVGGAIIGQQRWTQPVAAPLKVRLVQANIPQDAKFTAQGLRQAFEQNWALMQGSRADLIALPESVFPVPLGFVPKEALDAFRSLVQENRSGLIFGVFIEEPPQAYYNSAVGLAPDARTWQRRQTAPGAVRGVHPMGVSMVRRPDADADRRPGARSRRSAADGDCRTENCGEYLL